jgi:hypothetical protein
MMKRKLGPLQLWQWLLIGAVVGVGTYFYTRNRAPAPASATPSDAQFGPIDPTTGLPFASGGAGGGAPLDPTAVATPATNLPDLLAGFSQLEDLFAGMQSLIPTPGAATDTSGDTVATATGAKKASKKKRPKEGDTRKIGRKKQYFWNGHWHSAPKGAAHKKVTHPGKKNPGHHVTHHKGGKKTAHATAPHNHRQHHNVAPPAHQRHHPTHHPHPHPPRRRRHR